MTEEQIAKQRALKEILAALLNVIGSNLDDKQFLRAKADLKRIADKIWEF